MLQLVLDPLAAAQQIGERRAADDVAQRRLRRPAHRLRVVLHLERRLLRVVHHPEQHGVDVDRHRVGGQRLLGREARGDRALIDPRRHRVDERHDPEQARAAHRVKAAEAQHDCAVPLPRDSRRLHGDRGRRWHRRSTRHRVASGDRRQETRRRSSRAGARASNDVDVRHGGPRFRRGHVRLPLLSSLRCACSAAISRRA